MKFGKQEGHRITWYVYAGSERIRHTASMRGFWPGWDAECTCGWATRTGGATHGHIRERVEGHKWDVKLSLEEKA